MSINTGTSRFDLPGKGGLVTGGGGLLGAEHGAGLSRCGAKGVLIDIDEGGLERARERVLKQVPNAEVRIETVDITDEQGLISLKEKLDNDGVTIDILVNNAAMNPKMDKLGDEATGTVENYDMGAWQQEISVGITGTFLCCKVFGPAMAERGSGSIVNIASDLAIQAPDQRVYSPTGKMEDVKNFKPIGYPVVKSAMLGMSRYLATYWAHRNVRSNCLVPGAVFNDQSKTLVNEVKRRVPLGRWAERHEYQEAVAFLASNASSYMTGQELVMDGGRSIW